MSENSINIREGRKSSRPSVAAKMSQLASDKGDISYDSVLRIVGEEIDAEKKSKMLLRTSLLLLFSLLAVTAANAGLTFAVVEFAKDTKINGNTLTAKDSTEAVKVASTDFSLVDGRMVATDAPALSPSVVATADAFENLNEYGALTVIQEDSLDRLQEVESISVDTETGKKTYKVLSGEAVDESYVFRTASGAVVTMTNEGEVSVEENAVDAEGRKLWFRSSYSSFRFRRYNTSSRASPAGDNAYQLTAQPDYQAKKSSMQPIMTQKHVDSAKAYNTGKNQIASAPLDMSTMEAKVVSGSNEVVFVPKMRKLQQKFSGSLAIAMDPNNEDVRSIQLGNIQYYPVWMSDFPNGTQYQCQGGTVSDGNNTWDCSNVNLHAFLSLGQLGLTTAANDTWGYTASNGDEFVFIGSYDKVAVVDVSDPNTPVVLGNYNFSGNTYSGSALFGNSMWMDFKLIGDNMYATAQRDMSKIHKTDCTTLASHTVGNTINNSQLTIANYRGSHNLQAAWGNLYTFYNSGSLGWWDCSQYNYGIMISGTGGSTVGCIARTSCGDTHDGAFHQYGSTKVGFFTGGTEFAAKAISMYNLNNAASPSQITTVGFPSQGKYSHQPALTSNGNWMIVTDENDEIDGQTGGNIRLRSFDASASGLSNGQTVTTSIAGNDHQGYIYDAYYFLAALNSGFHVFDVSGNSIGSRVAYLDTSAATGTGFQGAWSVFVFPYNACNPYNTPGGGNTYYKTVISDRAGLFVVQPNFHTGSATICSSGSYPIIHLQYATE